MHLDLREQPTNIAYKLLTGTIIPRPIAWVSTISKAGQLNLAPFSFFNAMAPEPPTVVLGIGNHNEITPKDTLVNMRETGEFVVNIVTERLAEQMNLSAVSAPDSLNEFDFAGLTAAPSHKIAAPRVAESPVNFECIVKQIIPLDEDSGMYSLVIGEVVYAHFDDAIMLPDFRIDIEKLGVIGRLTGSSYATTKDTFDLNRPPSQLK